MNEKLIDLRGLISKMNLDGSGFLSFFELEHLQVGILRLKPGEKDMQDPHSSDEVYLVLEGDGFIEIGKKAYSRGRFVQDLAQQKIQQIGWGFYSKKYKTGLGDFSTTI